MKKTIKPLKPVKLDHEEVMLLVRALASHAMEYSADSETFRSICLLREKLLRLQHGGR